MNDIGYGACIGLGLNMKFLPSATHCLHLCKNEYIEHYTSQQVAGATKSNGLAGNRLGLVLAADEELIGVRSETYTQDLQHIVFSA